MKKICIVTTIEITILSFFIEQCEYLSNNGFDVTVVCSSCKNIKKILNEKIHCKDIVIARGIKPTSLKKSIDELTNFFKKEKFDIVQYSTPNAAFVTSYAAKKANIRVRNYHLMGFRYLGTSGFLRHILKFCEKITCDNSTHIECVSKSNLQLGIHEGVFSKNKAIVVWNGSSGGVNLSRFNYKNRDIWRNAIRSKLNIPKDDFVFGFVGRITKDKGINELLEAFFKMKENCYLIIVGKPEGIKTLNDTVYQQAVNSSFVKFVGEVNNVEEYYAAFDVLVFPSYREGFGMVVAEAAAIGTPAIISEIPGPIDAIEKNKTAITVTPKDSEDLCNKMRLVLNNEKLLNNMQKECIEFIKNSFDSKVLNQHILNRKNELLKY